MPWYSLSPELSDAIDFKSESVLTTCLPTVKDHSCGALPVGKVSSEIAVDSCSVFPHVTVFLESPSSSKFARQEPYQSLQVAPHLLCGSVRAFSNLCKARALSCISCEENTARTHAADLYGSFCTELLAALLYLKLFMLLFTASVAVLWSGNIQPCTFHDPIRLFRICQS